MPPLPFAGHTAAALPGELLFFPPTLFYLSFYQEEKGVVYKNYSGLDAFAILA